MGTFSDEVAGNVVSILALVMVATVALMIIVGGLVFGAVTGLVLGGGVAGYRYYQKKKLSEWQEPADATGLGLFEPGGTFLGEEINWD